MKRVYVGAVLTGLAVAAGACKGDPTSSLRNGPASLSVTPRSFFFDTGASGPLVVTVRDAQLNPVSALVTATSGTPSVATVVRDTTRPVIDSSTYAFLVTTGNLGRAKITITAAGVTDSSVVIVLPLAVGFAISDTTPLGGSVLTIYSTATLKFDPATVTVTFGTTNVKGTVLLATADSIQVLTAFSDRAPLTITGIIAAPGLEITRPTKLAVHQTGDRWAGDSSWQTAPDITALLPASGKSSFMLSTAVARNNKTVCPEFVGAPPAQASSGPCMMFAFTLADTATVNFTTNWVGGPTSPDVDIYTCSDSTVANFGNACFESGGAGATGVQPQSIGNFKYSAGTHYFVIENFGGAGSKDLYTTISRP